MFHRCTVSTTARQIGSVAVSGFEIDEELRSPLLQLGRLLSVGEGACEVIDDLVGIPGKPVERVDERSLGRRQEQRGQVVRLPVGGVEPTARLVGLTEARVEDACRVQLTFAHGDILPHRDATLPGDGASSVGCEQSPGGRGIEGRNAGRARAMTTEPIEDPVDINDPELFGSLEEDEVPAVVQEAFEGRRGVHLLRG